MAPKKDDNSSAEAPNFQDLLDTDASEFTVPEPLPVGTYLANIDSYEYIKSSKKETPGVRFTFSIQSAGSDVDGDELSKIDNLTKRHVREDMWLTPDSAFRIRELGEKAGIDVDGMSLRAVIEELPNHSVNLYIIRRPSDREGDDRMFNRITNIAVA